jgi:hypothetical protein
VCPRSQSAVASYASREHGSFGGQPFPVTNDDRRCIQKQDHRTMLSTEYSVYGII